MLGTMLKIGAVYGYEPELRVCQRLGLFDLVAVRFWRGIHLFDHQKVTILVVETREVIVVSYHANVFRNAQR